ncbi:MAG: SRPBCC domain-containing protein [Kineosporiaceae bacterium]
MSETPPGAPAENTRSIDLSVEVPGTPEEVWRAIATGPGISSWYVPHVVEERSGGAASASFGPGPEMQVPGRVAAWEPPHRIVFDGGEGVPGLAFEWLVAAKDGGTCVVRLVNTGFGDGQEWDDQYDGMREGWQLFLLNLRLHLAHFAGRTATPALPTAAWPTEPHEAWPALLQALGLSAAPAPGTRVVLDPADGPDPVGTLAGTVVDVGDRRLALVLDEPAPGTAFMAIEGKTAPSSVSVWSYLYGDERDRLAAAVSASWQRWLDTGHRRTS